MSWRVALLAALFGALVGVLLPLPVCGEAPAPLFTLRPVPLLCGALEDHLRVLDANDFEPSWRGSGGRGRVVVMVNDQGYWQLLLILDGAPDVACVAAEGQQLDIVPVLP